MLTGLIMVQKMTLTEERIRRLKSSVSDVFVWDAEAPGLAIRCYASGRKAFVFQYRAGKGRKAPTRRMLLGTAGLSNGLSLADARAAVRRFHGEIVQGGDPSEDQRESARRSEARLDRALGAYEKTLERRDVVNAKVIMATLRTGLLKPLGKIDVASIVRRDIANVVARIETGDGGKCKPRPGAAQDLRAKATTFLNWAANQGLIQANPLAGWRRERLTRAQTNNRSGRILEDGDIQAVWLACDGIAKPFGDFVRTLILLGQRRGETSLMRWRDIDTDGGVWTIPADVTKNGRVHRVPLPAIAREILAHQPVWKDCPYVFAGRGGAAMSGWSKRLPKLTDSSKVTFTLHDCRRTFRSGLSRFGVDQDVAELMLNHARADLIERYDREPRWADRQQAAQRWADHVAGLVGEKPSATVVSLRQTARP